MSAHVALGYVLGEWWAPLLAFAPVVLEPFFEDARWIPLFFVAYGIPAAVLLAVGVGMAKLRAFGRGANA